MDLEVEKVAKKKLVSASLMVICLFNSLYTKRRLIHAFSEWRSYILHSQVAETAFNKILEINHKHSAVRFHSATRILSRLFNSKNLKHSVHKLKSTTKHPHNMFSHSRHTPS